MDEHKDAPPVSLTLEMDSPEAEAVQLVPSATGISTLLQTKLPDDSNLSAEEKSAISEFAKKIDITNMNHILQYGGAAQTKISRFSETALSQVRTKDMDEVGGMISNLVMELKSFSPEEPKKKGIMSWFQKTGNQVTAMTTRYDTVERNVNKICDVLEDHKIILMKDIAVLDEMFDMNLNYFKELSMYILAGREKLEQIVTQEIPALQEKATQTGTPEDAQAANHLVDMCNRFDKKLHDLELTRTISLQMGPQIRLVQSNDSIMVEKIQSSLVNTIPLWKNQMVLALGLAHTQRAIEAQREVTNTTNELLKKNAEALKMGTVEAARESERGIVDIDTLVQTNESLISTLDEVMQIQQEGRAQRRAAEVELMKIEENIKGKLLELKNSGK